MTDYEYGLIYNLIDQKELSVDQLDSLDRWVAYHDSHGSIHWGSPQDIIIYLRKQRWR
jgi:hypothetical protein